MRLFAPLALALVASCTLVTSHAPLGSDPVSPAAADWDGTWASGFSAPVHLKVAPDGKVRMVYLNDEEDGLKAEVLDWTLMQHGDWTFASATNPDLDGEYLWVRVWREEEQLIAWLPAPQSLANLVKAGQLPGRVDEHDSVHLGSLEPQHLDLLTSDEGHNLIMWDKPLAFVRISPNTGF